MSRKQVRVWFIDGRRPLAVVVATLIVSLVACTAQTSTQVGSDVAEMTTTSMFPEIGSLTLPPSTQPSEEGVAQGNDSEPPASMKSAARRICKEARAQLLTIDGGGDIEIRQCEAQADSSLGVGWVIRLNDMSEWSTLLLTKSSEDLAFGIPLALVAYAFAHAGEDPSKFDKILIVFDDYKQTVYDFAGKDLAPSLKAETQEEAMSALRDLAERMQITALTG